MLIKMKNTACDTGRAAPDQGSVECLLLLDRRFDALSPLVTNFQYGAQLHESFYVESSKTPARLPERLSHLPNTYLPVCIDAIYDSETLSRTSLYQGPGKIVYEAVKNVSVFQVESELYSLRQALATPAANSAELSAVTASISLRQCRMTCVSLARAAHAPSFA